jgi:hypothetical protein
VQMFVAASNWLEIQTLLGKETAGIWDASKPAKDAAAEAARQMTPLLGQACRRTCSRSIWRREASDHWPRTPRRQALPPHNGRGMAKPFMC